MRKKLFYNLKIMILFIVILSMVLPSYASLFATDGSSFVTKAEFDSSMAEFNSRLTSFESGINSKIDSQVTTYLDRNGIWSGKRQNLATTWDMQDYLWTAAGALNGNQVINVAIGDGCSWGDVFGCLRSNQEWHLKYHDTNSHDQKEKGFSTWAQWETHYNSYYNEGTGYNSVLFAGANATAATTIGQVQWSPTMAVSLKNPSDTTLYPDKKIESVTWRILPEITKSGLLFLDFGQSMDFDAYINVNTLWQEGDWDTGMRYNFSLVFRRYNKNGVKIEDPWEEPWGDISDSKIKGTRVFIQGGTAKRLGSGDLPYSASSSQINISHFRKTINFFVSKGDKIDAVVTTTGFNHAKSYLGRHNWSWNASSRGTSGMHGPVFNFYNAIVY